MARYYRRRMSRGRKYIGRANRTRIHNTGYNADSLHLRLRGFSRGQVSTAAWLANGFNGNAIFSANYEPMNVITLVGTRWVIAGYTQLAAQYATYKVLSADFTAYYSYAPVATDGANISRYSISFVNFLAVDNSAFPTTLDNAQEQPEARWTDLIQQSDSPKKIRIRSSYKMLNSGQSAGDALLTGAFGGADPTLKWNVGCGAAFLSPVAVGAAGTATFVYDYEIIWNVIVSNRKVLVA